MVEIPPYIEERLRRPPPPGMCIVPGSTPVLSFGSLSSATFATLGLNPSRDEFLDGGGGELRGADRRLATLASLATTDLSAAPPDALLQIVDDCKMYFGRKPYRRWFDQLEYILAGCGASYYKDGSACHLDLIQWATDPTWSGLDPGVRSILLRADAPFLAKQLSNSQVQVLLINGKAVVEQFQESFNVLLADEPPIALDRKSAKSDFRSGKLFDRIGVIGWTTNLQSSHGVTSEFRATLRDRVGTLAKKLLGERNIAERAPKTPAAK
jgi:hypothetical protein